MALAASGGSVVAFAAANAVVIFIVSCLQVGVTRRLAHIAWRAGLSLWRPLARVAIPLGIAVVMITIYYQVDSVLLLQIAGPTEAGIYGAAYGFLAPLIFLPAAIMSSFFPVLTAVYHRDPARARRLVQISTETMTVVGLPFLAGSIALSGPVIKLIFGDGFEEAAGLLPILMIAFVAICYGTLAGFLAPLLGMQWRFAIYTTIGAAANVVLNLVADTAVRGPWVGLGDGRHRGPDDVADVRHGPASNAAAAPSRQDLKDGGARRRHDRSDGADGTARPDTRQPDRGARLCGRPVRAAHRQPRRAAHADGSRGSL